MSSFPALYLCMQSTVSTPLPAVTSVEGTVYPTKAHYLIRTHTLRPGLAVNHRSHPQAFQAGLNALLPVFLEHQYRIVDLLLFSLFKMLCLKTLQCITHYHISSNKKAGRQHGNRAKILDLQLSISLWLGFIICKIDTFGLLCKGVTKYSDAYLMPFLSTVHTLHAVSHLLLCTTL